MKFPSVKGLTTGALNTLKRFPFESFFALAATIACTVRIQARYNTWHIEDWWLRIMMVANLGLLLSLSTSLFVESKGYKGPQKVFHKMRCCIIFRPAYFYYRSSH